MARKAAVVLNQNQSWNLSLEGAWNSTTVNGITENRTFNEVYKILTSNNNPLTHDRKGNLTQNQDSSQYTWDYNNQLSHAINVAGDHPVTSVPPLPRWELFLATYDALDRRISKQANGITTVYVNTGYQIAVEYQSTDGINFSEKQSYVYDTYIDDPLVLVKASGERFYYHSNAQFSISKITDEYKNVVEAYAYNAYGDMQVLQNYNNNLDNPYYFTGRQLDQETGLFYFRARYYDAKLGQFISRDPIGYVDGMSLYRGYFAVNGADAEGKASSNLVSVAATVGIVAVYSAIKGSVHASQESEMPECKNCTDSSSSNPIYYDKGGNCCIKINLACRPIDGLVGSIGGAKHCFLKISNANGNALGTISAFPENNQKPYGNIAYGPDGDLGGIGEATVYPFSMGGKTACEYVQCAHEYAVTLSGPYAYGVTYNNSNTFVAKIVRHCGGTANFPFGAFGSDDID